MFQNYDLRRQLICQAPRGAWLAQATRWVALSCLLLQACGGGGGSPPSNPVVITPEPEPATGLWVQSTSGGGLQRYTEGLNQLVQSRSALFDDAIALTAVADAPAAETAGFSSTYTVDAAVDEYDIVKYDGSILAVAPSRSSCCFIAEIDVVADALIAPPAGNSEIRLFSTQPQAGSATPVSTIALAEDQRAEGLYLQEGTLQVLLSTAWWGTFGPRFITPDYWVDQQVSIIHYDLSNPSSPTKASTTTIEGALVASRRLGDDIFLITRHAPKIEGLIAYPQTAEEAAANETLLASVSAEQVLPSITIDDSVVSPLSLDECYRIDPEHELATPTPSVSMITTLLAISASTGEIKQSACTLEPVSGVYLGQNLIALTHVRWDLDNGGTLLHLLDRSNFNYRGSEQLAGALYSGGNADFRVNEFDGTVRLVTTERTDDPDDLWQHRLYILSPHERDAEIERLGLLGEDQNIGKPNEDLYGVRFMGSRAYLVTFERIDPLYVIDLSDPRQPTIAGELEVPGFSDLLHEVSSDLLLGVGGDARNRPKIELYNIANISQPQSQSLISLGAEWYWSYTPARYDRHAFTYLAGEESDRFTVPYSGGGLVDNTYVQEDRIALFEIQNKANPAAALIAPVGEVTLSSGSVDGSTRVVIDSDALYVITWTDLLSGFWSNPEAMTDFGTE